MESRPFVRLAPWLLLAAVAYGVGLWQGRARAPGPEPQAVTEVSAPTTVASDPPSTPPAEPPLSRAERIAGETARLAETARYIASPDARTYAFFESLGLEDVGAVAATIEALPPGNEQDVMFIMLMRRWGHLDGPAALARATTFPALGTRENARLAAFEAWGMERPGEAFARAVAEPEEAARARATTSVLAGAAMRDPRQALTLWEASAESFRDSEAGIEALAQIASAAYGTGKREAVQRLVADLPEGGARARLIETLVAEWGAHHPAEALAWLDGSVASEEARTAAANGLFSNLVRKNPALAATWAAGFDDDTRRTSYIAAAVQEWARLDAVGAETWVNEQPSGPYLDGAGYAMAAHYLARRDMSRSFGWVRRINLPEMRAELMGTLGRVWAKEEPEAFKNFLDGTSLNRAELEMLLAKIPPAS